MTHRRSVDPVAHRSWFLKFYPAFVVVELILRKMFLAGQAVLPVPVPGVLHFFNTAGLNGAV